MDPAIRSISIFCFIIYYFVLKPHKRRWNRKWRAGSLWTVLLLFIISLNDGKKLRRHAALTAHRDLDTVLI